MIKKILLIIALLLFLPQVASAALDLDITKTRLDWRTWQFQALGLNEANVYLWDFGDGSLSDAAEPIHGFPRWGKHKITLSVSDFAGKVGSVEDQISIGFWHIQNPWLQALLGFLGLGIVALIGFIVFNKLPKLKDG